MLDWLKAISFLVLLFLFMSLILTTLVKAIKSSYEMIKGENETNARSNVVMYSSRTLFFCAMFVIIIYFYSN